MSEFPGPDILALLALALLGACQGVNPGTGWLLAVARGNISGAGGRGVGEGVVLIGLGQALGVAAVAAALAVAMPLLSRETLWLAVAGALILVGLYRTVHMRGRAAGHGMRVGPLALVRWSVRRCWAQGVGLMLAPVVLGLPLAGSGGALPASLVALAVGVYTLALLATLAAMALACHRSFGTRPLRKWWLNMDLAWVALLLGTGLAMLFS